MLNINLIIREMQIKATPMYHFTPFRMATIFTQNKTKNNFPSKPREKISVDQDVKKCKPCALSVGCKMAQPLQKTL